MGQPLHPSTVVSTRASWPICSNPDVGGMGACALVLAEARILPGEHDTRFPLSPDVNRGAVSVRWSGRRCQRANGTLVQTCFPASPAPPTSRKERSLDSKTFWSFLSLLRGLDPRAGSPGVSERDAETRPGLRRTTRSS